MRYSLMKRDSVLVLFTLLLAVWMISAAPQGFPLDDSWIHQVYGRNLARTGEWAFVPGVPSAASTSPLYTVLLAIGYVLGAPPVLWAHALGVASLALTGVIVAHLAQALAPHLRGAGALAGVFTVMTWHLLWAAGAGMETPVFALFTVLVVWLAYRETSAPTAGAWRRAVVWGALAGCTFLARPEGIAVIGLAGLALLLTRPRAWQWGAVAAVSALLVVSPYLALNWQVTGGLLPNTAAAKFAQQAPLLALPLPVRYADLFIAVMAGGQFLLLPAVLFVVWRARAWARREQIWLAVLLLWVLALWSVYALRLPAPYHHARYLMPLLPSWVLVGALGLLELLRWGRYGLWRRVATRTLFGATCLTFAFFALVTVRQVYRVDVSIVNEEIVGAALWVRDNIPQDALLAVHDIGAIGFFTTHTRLIDIAGLISPEVVPIVRDGDALWRLLEERGAAYIVGFPDHFPNHTAKDPRLCHLYSSNGTTSRSVGGPTMSVYRIAWNKTC